MREIIHSLPEQIVESIKLFNFAWGNISDKTILHRKFERVLICGMGGSGISGDIASVLYPELNIVVNKDYKLPRYIDKKTLGILVSYSGNTEETLNNYNLLRKKGIAVVVISSNGRLLKDRASLRIQIPQGFPPRGALGYLFTPIPLLLYRIDLIKKNPEKELIKLSGFLRKQAGQIEKKAKNLVELFIGKLPIIYANSDASGVIARRWQCQLNENSKILCHTNIIPEMNHNEIVGIGRPPHLNKDLIVVFINDHNAFIRNKIRVRIIKDIINEEIKGLKYIDINPTGRNPMERIFSTVMLGDFLSCYLALKTGVDPLPVKRIDYLKNRLSKSK
ncbi:MAG: bifunctional phosphoglucose/phosphomannose isomerase [candidate division WOR-3 bacterium]